MQASRQYPFSVTGKTGIRLLLFCTSWSTPCRQQQEILDTFCNQYGNEKVITCINIDRLPHLADRWEIQTIPTALLLDGNREINRFIGLLSVERLRGILTEPMPPADQVGQWKPGQRR